MRMGQGVRTGLGHGGTTCVLQTQFSSFLFLCLFLTPKPQKKGTWKNGIIIYNMKNDE